MIKNGCGGGGARGPLLKGLARRLWKHHEPNILIHFIAVSQSKVFVCNNSHCCFLCAALFVVVRSFIIITIITIMIIMIMISRFSHSAATASPRNIHRRLDEAPGRFPSVSDTHHCHHHRRHRPSQSYAAAAPPLWRKSAFNQKKKKIWNGFLTANSGAPVY